MFLDTAGRFETTADQPILLALSELQDHAHSQNMLIEPRTNSTSSHWALYEQSWFMRTLPNQNLTLLYLIPSPDLVQNRYQINADFFLLDHEIAQSRKDFPSLD